MPDPKSLVVGDRIPVEWPAEDHYMPAESVALMERLIQRRSSSRVSEIDDSGYPRIRAQVLEPDGVHYHHWLITESTGWRRVIPHT